VARLCVAIYGDSRGHRSLMAGALCDSARCQSQSSSAELRTVRVSSVIKQSWSAGQPGVCGSDGVCYSPL